MMEKLKAFKDNILLFSVGCYALGFIYMVSYYYSFKLPIIYYITLNDILLFALTIILPTALITLSIEFVAFPIMRSLLNIFLVAIKRKPLSDQVFLNLIIFITTIFIVLLVLLSLVFNKFHLHIDPQYQFLFFMCSSLVLIRNIDLSDRSNIVFNGIIFCLFIALGMFNIKDTTKFGVTNTDIKFTYEGKIIQSKYYSNYAYIGETSSSIFLYDIGEEFTTVFEKNKISQLSYSDQIKNFDWIIEKIKLPKGARIKHIKVSDTTVQYDTWMTKDNIVYRWHAKQTSSGLLEIKEKLDSLLLMNAFDKEIPIGDRSIMPGNSIELQDYKKLNDVYLSGDYEIQKWWSNEKGYINYILNKDGYFIELSKKW